MRRRPEDVLTLLAGTAAVVLFAVDVGGVVAPVIALLIGFGFQVRPQLDHNAERRRVIAEFRRTAPHITEAERARELEEIQLYYGKNHPAVRRLVAEEQRTIGSQTRDA